jgi:hypothetical protein
VVMLNVVVFLASMAALEIAMLSTHLGTIWDFFVPWGEMVRMEKGVHTVANLSSFQKLYIVLLKIRGSTIAQDVIQEAD